MTAAKNGCFAILLLLFSGVLVAEDRVLFEAIKRVESNGNRYAVGDRGKSFGAYQIQRKYWNDSGIGKNYDRHVWDEKSCERAMELYWKRFGARSREEKARIHNGGPRGMKARATKDYWLRVKAEIKNIERGN